jgi:glycosyltransferase involved in cell wall biosynthesis
MQAPPTTTPQPRILLLQTQSENAGAQEIARVLGKGLKQRGFDVSFGFFYRRTAGYDQAPGVFFAAPERPGGIGETLAMARNLHRHIKRISPDAVITFQHYGNVIGAPVARLAGVGTVIANLNTAKAILPRWVPIADWLLATLRIYSRVVANSIDTEADFRALPAPFGRHLMRIDHGFEPKLSRLSKAEARAALSLPASVTLLGMSARLHPEKNQGALIELLRRNQDWHVALAGQGPSRQALSEHAARAGCANRLHLVGELEPERVGLFLNALDVFTFTSLHESFGLAVVEAANAGVPVVSNDLDVLHEVLHTDDGPCALFADVSDIAAFEAAVVRALTDTALRTELVSRGKTLRGRYSVDAMTDGYVAALADLGVSPSTCAQHAGLPNWLAVPVGVGLNWPLG